MYQIRVGVEGIVPILFNRMTEQTIEAIGKHKTGGKMTVAQHRELALLKVYRNGNGLVCPAKNIKKAIRMGATQASLKYGKKGLEPFLNSLMFIEESHVEFGETEPHFVDEQMGRVPPRTGARVMIYRPGLNAGWKLNFILVLYDNRIPEENVRTATEEAGILQGLCDGRPEFGRFTLTEWELLKTKK